MLTNPRFKLTQKTHERHSHLHQYTPIRDSDEYVQTDTLNTINTAKYTKDTNNHKYTQVNANYPLPMLVKYIEYTQTQKYFPNTEPKYNEKNVNT